MRWIFKATRATAGPVGFERRPADGEFARRIVSHEEANVAVLLAVTLVGWFDAGLVARRT